MKRKAARIKLTSDKRLGFLADEIPPSSNDQDVVSSTLNSNGLGDTVYLRLYLLNEVHASFGVRRMVAKVDCKDSTTE
jgi:hypothetical protein